MTKTYIRDNIDILQSSQTYPGLVLSPGLNTTYVHNTHSLGQLADYLARCGGITGWDIETTPVQDYFHRKCRTIQFGNKEEQYVIDLLAFCYPEINYPRCEILSDCQGGYGKSLHLAPGLKPVFDLIGPVLCNRDVLKVGVSLSFEYMTMYWNFGLRTQHFFDCGLVEKVICAGYHSFKDYGHYSMEELMQRYYGQQIDKTLQESFTIDEPLSQAQIEYAALDTRLPIAIKRVQDLILKGKTRETEKDLARFSTRLLGDDLTLVAQLENDAIGAFQDMHLHGERLDREKWLKRVDQKKAQLTDLITNRLDPIFLPLVGSKLGQTSQEEVDVAHQAWKDLTLVTTYELDLTRDLRMAVKREKFAARHPGQLFLYNDETPLAWSGAIQLELDWTEAIRLCEKDRLKYIWNEMSKKNTRIKDLKAECDGEALINYGSDTQLLHCINANFPEIRQACGKDKTGEYKLLENLDDDTFEQYGQFPVLKLIQEYHDLSKVINTYGDAWAMEWVTHPCKEEGWLHPGDGRLHSTTNQLEAETGRSSSEKPNGQNIERDKEVRSCFIADPPDQEEPDGYVIVTADMSGAELRILAELANDPIWIGAFERKEDVHCICAELMDQEEWISLTSDDCAYYLLRVDGTPQHKKCLCPGHDLKRNSMKPTNFGLPYGISSRALSKQIGKTQEETQKLMSKHAEAFPRIWQYLDVSGAMTLAQMKSFDMFGRRRIFSEPTRDLAFRRAQIYKEEELRLPEEEAGVNLAKFFDDFGRKPIKEEKFVLTHREPEAQHIKSAERALYNGIERQGKNHRIQGTNASIAKVAMGAGYSSDGKPYLWHTLGQFKARLIKFVHDELVVQCPARFGEEVAALIGDAFKRAGAEVMRKVTMEFEYNIGQCWSK